MRTIEMEFIHMCDDVPIDARFCPHCGAENPYAELAFYLIKCAIAEIKAEAETQSPAVRSPGKVLPGLTAAVA